MPLPAEPQPALANAIRKLRGDRGLTQEDLAHEAAITTAALARIESGRVNPTWATVRRVAGGLGVPLSELAALAERFEAK